MKPLQFRHFSPDETFWESYASLWHCSAGRSPFQSPAILRYFASLEQHPLTIVCGLRDEQMVAAAVFRNKRNTLEFLSDHKTDANFFVFNRDCSAADHAAFFRSLFQTAENEGWSLRLNNQPAWADYWNQLNAAGQASSLYWMNIPYSVCPVVAAETPADLFRQINGSRELRYRVNRLKNQENAVFEVFTDDTALEEWVTAFCQSHIARWAETPTPSGFHDPARQQFLLQCLKAWNRDGILLRFSVRVPEGRIGFVVGLREAGSIVHHSTTYHPEYRKFSPGKALIHFMSGWMAENGYGLLDFGDGDEPYKYSVANAEHTLHRIFATRTGNLPFIFKTQAIRMLRSNARVYRLYRDKIKVIAQRLKT